MAAIKTLIDITKKWTTVTPQRTNDYTQGVTNPRVDWEAASVEGADSWAAGVQAAVTEGRFAKGVNKAGTAKWKSKAIEKGPVRWAQGVQLASDDFSRGYGPYREAIAALTLPPRFARRDPRNIDRVSAIVNAMIATKQAQG